MSDRLFGGYDKDLQRQYNETTKAEVYEDFMGYVEADAANDEIMSVARQLIDKILHPSTFQEIQHREKTIDKKQKQALEKIKDGLYPKAGSHQDMIEKAREYIQSSKILEK